MNKLVNYMEKYYGALGTMFRFTRIEKIIEETGWTRKEIWLLAMEADAVGELVASYSFRGNKWKNDDLAEDLITVGTISSSWKPHHKKGLQR
jgi:hypothetical protein